jgi:hypothetical protein
MKVFVCLCVFCFADPPTRGWVEIDTLDADHGDFGRTDGKFWLQPAAKFQEVG